jgi:hypothetical protein
MTNHYCYNQSKPIPIPKKNKEIGINKINEIDYINSINIEHTQNKIKLQNHLLSQIDKNIPPTIFNPSTPPEYNLLYTNIVGVDSLFLSNYNKYYINDTI